MEALGLGRIISFSLLGLSTVKFLRTTGSPVFVSFFIYMVFLVEAATISTFLWMFTENFYSAN